MDREEKLKCAPVELLQSSLGQADCALEVNSFSDSRAATTR